MIQIPQIRTDIPELDKFTEEINNRLDQISRALNELEVCVDNLEEEGNEQRPEEQEDYGTVYRYISGKFVKLGKMNLTNTPNGSLFEDGSDGKLKYKDHSGTVTTLT